MKKKYGKLEELTDKDWEEMLKGIFDLKGKGKQVVSVFESDESLVAKLSLDGRVVLIVTFYDDVTFRGVYLKCEPVMLKKTYSEEIHKQVLKFLIRKFGKVYADYYTVQRREEIDKKSRRAVEGLCDFGKALTNCEKALKLVGKIDLEDQVGRAIDSAKEEIAKEVDEILAEIGGVSV